ncbi:hypothetical protein LTS15_000016 [Exophiala xenobiotica]|nr:hypothetical protein LTS15_000016 [Exophiala xenobiotica]
MHSLTSPSELFSQSPPASAHFVGLEGDTGLTGYGSNHALSDTPFGQGLGEHAVEFQHEMAGKRPRSSARGRYGCKTCRQRHLKCDETRPICDKCTKAKRECHWNHDLRLRHDSRSSVTTVQLPSQSGLNDNSSFDPSWAISKDLFANLPSDNSGNYITSVNSAPDAQPLEILSSPLEASLFTFYISHAGPWLDITSPSRHFSLTVPRLALQKPVLLYACLAYSSRTLLPLSSLNDQYGSACIRLLIPRLSDESYVSHDETLLATLVILRHVEQYADTLENEGAHLSGAFSLIASQKQLPTQDSLPGAALWTYMRQDVRQALLARASPKLTPRYGIRLDTLTSVDEHACQSSWADSACHMAAMACTFAWGGEEGEVDADQLELMLGVWLENLPGEYHPFFASGNVVRYIATWHVVAWQFYHLAKVLLKLYNSRCPRGVDVVTFNSRVEMEIVHHARTICNISYSNPEIGSRFNACAILGFIGTYLRDKDEQLQLVKFMDAFSKQTNWPTDSDRRRLESYWKLRSDEPPLVYEQQ